MVGGAVTRSLDIIIFGRDFPSLCRMERETPEDEEKWVTHFSRRNKVSSTSRGSTRGAVGQARNIDGQ